MRNDLLFIDGELVDLDDSTRITLKYVSNIFTDLSKIVSNNSYTIKLPNTVRNQRIIDHADLPACDTDYQRRVHKARYFRNGVEILSNAQAVLMSVGDTIEIALSWGNIVNFANIVNGGKKLTDLTQGTTENEDWAVWKNWGQNSALFPKVNYGFNDGEPNAWYHPCVTVQRVIGDILYENDVIFNVPDDAFNLLDKIIVPLLTKNDSQDLYDKFPVNFAADGYVFGQNTGTGMEVQPYICSLKFRFNGDSSQTKYGITETLSYSGESYSMQTQGYKFSYKSDNVKLKGFISTSFMVPRTPEINDVKLYVLIDGKRISTIQANTLQNSGKNQWTASFIVNLNFSVNEGQILTFELFPGGWMFMGGSNVASMMSINLSISKRGEVLFGEKFPFVPNLPDMKQIDFIKGIMSMLGLFAIPQGNNKIKFVSVDDIIANKSRAVDWTKKVIASSYENKPKSMNYILDSFARNNRFKWKEDSTVTGNYEGNIVINDNTIEYERDAVTLPFAASDTKGEVAYIPIYSYKDDGSLTGNSKNVKPRLLYLDGVKGVFKGLEWGKLIEDNYSSYRKIVSNPKIITEKIEVSDIELKNLDLAVPVYLGQYGRFYAIISIKAEDTGICESKLLQLEV